MSGFWHVISAYISIANGKLPELLQKIQVLLVKENLMTAYFVQESPQSSNLEVEYLDIRRYCLPKCTEKPNGLFEKLKSEVYMREHTVTSLKNVLLTTLFINKTSPQETCRESLGSLIELCGSERLPLIPLTGDIDQHDSAEKYDCAGNRKHSPWTPPKRSAPSIKQTHHILMSSMTSELIRSVYPGIVVD
jgi:hypothetical protein